MTHDNTEEPTVKATSHPWAVLEGGTPLFHVPGTYPPEYARDDALEALWLEGQTMQPYYSAGGITIYHGDCKDVLLSLREKPALVLTDPPYGDDHDTDYTRFTGGVAASFGSHAAIAGDCEQFDPRPLLKIGERQILFGCNRFSHLLPVGSLLIWDKRTPYGSKNVMSDAEPAWDSHGRGVYIFSHAWDGFNRASERQTKYHPSQKPVALMRWCLMRAKLAPGALVFDPYMGSGPVAQACKELGYRYIGCELVEQYCETATKRLQQEVMQFESEAA